MISCSCSNRKRQIAMPASKPVRAIWHARPVLTGDIRPEALGGKLAGDVVRISTPGRPAWSPPI